MWRNKALQTDVARPAGRAPRLSAGVESSSKCRSYREASHVSKAASSRHPAFPRSRATIGGSHSFMAASFMRTVISAYRFVVSRLTCPSQPRITFTSTPASRRCTVAVCRLCRWEHSRHYLPFLTMSRRAMPASFWRGKREAIPT